MPAVDIALLDGSTRPPLPAPTACTITRNAHGLAVISAAYPLSRYRSFDLVNRLRADQRIVITAGGQRIADGRVEDIAITDAGATVQAFGRWRALSDVPYTAFWSQTTWDGFRQSTLDDFASARPERFFFDDADGARYIGPSQTGGTYAPSGANAALGELTYAVPHLASREIVGAQFRMQLVAATSWRFQFTATNREFASSTGTVTATHAGTDLDIAYHLTVSSRARVRFSMLSAVSQVFSQNPGDYYIRLSRLRLVGSTAGRVNTTLTANRAAGSGVTATVGSTSGMYAGMDLVINSGNTTSEIVTVTSVTNSTQFVATFVGSYTTGQAVQGFRVTGDEIAKDGRDQTNTANTDALSASNALISSPGLDLLDQVYEDAAMGQVLTSLAEWGDSAGQRYETGVDGDRLFFRVRGSAGLSWYVDVADLQIQQTLDHLVNSVYARYEDASGRTLRTAPQVDSVSIARYGLTRRQAIDAATTNATLAAAMAQTARDDLSDPPPRAGLTVRAIATSSGARAPLWQVRPGDTLTIRNLPPVAGPAIDRIRTFRIAETTYDAGADALSIVPETPLPDLPYLLARREAFGARAGGPLSG